MLKQPNNLPDAKCNSNRNQQQNKCVSVNRRVNSNRIMNKINHDFVKTRKTKATPTDKTIPTQIRVK